MTDLQNLLQDHSKLTKDKQKENYQKVKQIISDNTNVDESGIVIIDKQRNFTQKQKEEIWENAKEYKQFVKEFARVDIVGNVIIKGIQRVDSIRKPLSGENEHIQSYSQGGETNVENACLLQGQINNKKREKPLYQLDRKEYLYLKNKYGVKPKELVKGLENDYDNTCKKFNMVFEKIDKKWQPVVLAKTKGGKYIYKPYYIDEYDFYYKTFMSENELDKLDKENYEKLNEFYNFKKNDNLKSNESKLTEETKEETEEKSSNVFEKMYAAVTSLSYLQVAVGIVVIGGICYGSYKIYQYYQDKKKQKEIYDKYQENIKIEKENLIKYIEDTKYIEDENELNSYKDSINYNKKFICENENELLEFIEEIPCVFLINDKKEYLKTLSYYNQNNLVTQYCDYKYDQQQKIEISNEAEELDKYYKKLDEIQAKKK
jgi:hypothetical protein